MPAKYRKLKQSEIRTLQSNGCSADDWGNITVLDGFNPVQCRNVIFSGAIRLGIFDKPFVDESGVSTPGGILNARLHNCTVGSDVVITVKHAQFLQGRIPLRITNPHSSSQAFSHL